MKKQGRKKGKGGKKPAKTVIVTFRNLKDTCTRKFRFVVSPRE